MPSAPPHYKREASTRLHIAKSYKQSQYIYTKLYRIYMRKKRWSEREVLKSKTCQWMSAMRNLRKISFYHRDRSSSSFSLVVSEREVFNYTKNWARASTTSATFDWFQVLVSTHTRIFKSWAWVGHEWLIGRMRSIRVKMATNSLFFLLSKSVAAVPFNIVVRDSNRRSLDLFPGPQTEKHITWNVYATLSTSSWDSYRIHSFTWSQAVHSAKKVFIYLFSFFSCSQKWWT